MKEMWKMIDDIKLLYIEINRLQCLLDNKIRVGEWVADRYCSKCEWDKKEAAYTSGWRENYCPNCGVKIKGADDDK